MTPHGDIATAEATRQRPARVWVLLGHKAGDNNQVLALAEGLGLPFERKVFSYRRSELLSNILLGPNLLGTVPEESARLAPPWPDLVITSGRRNEPIALWIREQGGPGVRLVHIGRPWSHPDRFDLVITTPQYTVPAADNVLLRELPMHRVDAAKVAEAARRWKPKLSHLPHPHIAVLVGGQSGPFHLDRKKGARLARQACRLARAQGGSLLVTSSARTPDAALDVLAGELDVPSFVYRWRAGDVDNPYLAFLGLADAFVVTSESMSMLAEACFTRKPVYMFDMDDRSAAGGQDATSAPTRWLNALRYKALTHRIAQRLAPRRMRRDIGRMHRALIASGRAVWLGQPFPDIEPPPVPDGSAASEKVRALLPAEPDR